MSRTDAISRLAQAAGERLATGDVTGARFLLEARAVARDEMMTDAEYDAYVTAIIEDIQAVSA